MRSYGVQARTGIALDHRHDRPDGDPNDSRIVDPVSVAPGFDCLRTGGKPGGVDNDQLRLGLFVDGGVRLFHTIGEM